MRLLRAGEPVPATLPEAISELGLAVWALAGAFDEPDRADAVRGHALRAGALAGDAQAGEVREVVGQIRSTAVDLRRAADLLYDTAVEEREAPTEELLAAPR